MSTWEQELSIYQRFCHLAVLPLADLALGHHVSARLRELDNFQWQDRSKIEAYQRQQLSRLFGFARQHVPYYQDCLPARAGNGDQPEDDLLRGLPILTKDVLRSQGDRLKVANHEGRVYEMMSSGSTGEQTRVLVDRRCLDEVYATQLLFWRWGGFALGAPHLQTGMSLRRGWVKGIKDLVFRCSFHGAFDLTDAHLEAMTAELVGRRIRFLFGYASSLYVLARHLDRSRRRLALQGVFTWGDSLFPHYRGLMEETFGCRVTERLWPRRRAPMCRPVRAARRPA